MALAAFCQFTEHIFGNGCMKQKVFAQSPTTGVVKIVHRMVHFFSWSLHTFPGSAIILRIGALAQLGERKVRNLEVRGSIPLCSTTYQAETVKCFKVFQTVSPCGVCGFQDSLKRFRPFLFLRLFCQLFANFSKISMRKICQLFLKPGGRFLSRVAAFFADFFKGHWAKVANFFIRSFFPDIRLTVPSSLA